MSIHTEEIEWKKLGIGDILLLSGRRIVSVGIGVVVVVALLNIDKLPISFGGIFESWELDEYIPLVQTSFKWLVGLYFLTEFLILIWDLLSHFAIRYRLAPDSVVKKGGVYRTFTHTIPGSRVQGVEVTASPLQRLVKVSDVTITTAGVHSPNMTIHNLATSEAVAIQNQLGVDRD